MRHFYFRLFACIIWMAAAAVSALGANLPFAALYAVLGILFLRAARASRKKNKSAEDGR